MPAADPRRQDARDLLMAYHAEDRQQREFKARMQDLLDTPEPFARTQTAPGHFTASAFMLDAPQRKALLIYHDKLGRWLQPGGHVEPTDAGLARAAARELTEETGFTEVPLVNPGIFDIDIHLIPARGVEAAHLHFDVRFLFRLPEGREDSPGGSLTQRWIDLTQVPEPEPDDSVSRVLQRIRLHLASVAPAS